MQKEPEGLAQVPKYLSSITHLVGDAASLRKLLRHREQGWDPWREPQELLPPQPRLQLLPGSHAPRDRVMLLGLQRKGFAQQLCSSTPSPAEEGVCSAGSTPSPAGGTSRPRPRAHANAAGNRQPHAHATLRKELSLFLKASLFLNSFKT